MKKVGYIILTIILIIPLGINALEIEDLNSKNVIVYNKDEGKIIYEKNADEKTKIASLTKIMTTIIAIENIEDLNEKVTITSSMLNGIPYDASTAGLKVGETYTYDELLYASMIPSGADATQALAISLTGSIKNFVKKMNDKAKELDMENTNFINTTGLDEEGHYSTAKDVLTLLNYSLENETFKKYFEATINNYTLSNGLELKSTLKHYNNLGYDLSYVKGSKTGYTGDAGLCLGTLSNIDNTNIITITINAPYENRNKNVIDLNTIYTSLKKNYSKINLVEEEELLTTLKTKYAKEDNTRIRATKTISRYIEKPYNEENLKIEYIGEEEISSTIDKGEQVGTIKIYYKDEFIEEIPAIISDELHFSVWSYLKENIIYYSLLILIIIGTLTVVKKPKRKIRRTA